MHRINDIDSDFSSGSCCHSHRIWRKKYSNTSTLIRLWLYIITNFHTYHSRLVVHNFTAKPSKKIWGIEFVTQVCMASKILNIHLHFPFIISLHRSRLMEMIAHFSDHNRVESIRLIKFVGKQHCRLTNIMELNNYYAFQVWNISFAIDLRKFFVPFFSSLNNRSWSALDLHSWTMSILFTHSINIFENHVKIFYLHL